MGSGQWLFPDGAMIPKLSNSSPFLSSRATQVVHLMRRDNVMSLPGSYCCTIPDSKSRDNTFCSNLVGK